jgi:hypothetical protein
MSTCKYLFLLILAASLASCKPKGGKNHNKQPAPDSPKATDTAVKLDIPYDMPVPLSQLIVPGISVGQTAINEASESVHKKLGRPDGGDAAMGKSISIWYANHDTASYQTQMYFSRDMGNDETSRVKMIRITSPWFKVSNSLFTGRPVKIAQDQFRLKKIATFTDKGNTYTIYDDQQGGISFEADEKGTCTGITVHQPGREATGTYLPFYSNLKILK